jgi:paired small multidrug resistance pump
MELLIQIAGWIGTSLVLLAYFLVSSKKLSATSFVYQLMNLFGVIGVGISVYHQHAWSALALQSVWGIIAAVSLIKIQARA